MSQSGLRVRATLSAPHSQPLVRALQVNVLILLFSAPNAAYAHPPDACLPDA